MNKTMAKKIARSGIITGDIWGMLRRAHDAGAADNTRSIINPGLSKAVTFNMLWKGYKKEPRDKIIKGSAIERWAHLALREFGEYWTGFRPKATRRKKPTGDFHHEPVVNIHEEKETP